MRVMSQGASTLDWYIVLSFIGLFPCMETSTPIDNLHSLSGEIKKMVDVIYVYFLLSLQYNLDKLCTGVVADGILLVRTLYAYWLVGGSPRGDGDSRSLSLLLAG